ncbi:hypothetical protein H6504_05680 [Candidatus Woesearchaeota archaeon]|nr:hypothetical protein [Candidatus Woesearchaeota archaeon]
MKEAVAIILAAFTFVLGNIYLFGLIDTLTEEHALALFTFIYFALCLSFFGVIYLQLRKALHSNIEQIMLLTAIGICCMSMAFFAQTAKSLYDAEQFIANEPELVVQEQYQQDLLFLEGQYSTIKANNEALRTQMSDLKKKIENKPPIVVENIVTIPAEVVYVFEDEYDDENVNVYEYDDEYDDEREDDD